MIAEYNKAVVTETGKSLLNAVLERGASMTFTRFATGDGIYTGTEKTKEQIRTRTAMKNERNTYSIASSEVKGDTLKMKFVITNYDAETDESIVIEDYYANEIGLFAQSEGGEEILFSLSVCSGDHGDAILAYNGRNPIQIIQSYGAVIGDAEVSISMTGAYAFAEDLAEETQERIKADFDALYGLCKKTTSIVKRDGQKTITERSDDATATTTFEKDTAYEYSYYNAFPEGDENPSEKGWFEKSGDDFIPTEDETVEEGKTYYDRETYAFDRTTITTVIVTDDTTYTKVTAILKRDGSTTIKENYTKEDDE